MIKLNKVSVDVGGVPLFKNISMLLQSKKYGLVGPNGVGKSTLAKIIAEEHPIAAGTLQRQGTIVRLPQSQVAPPVTVAEFSAEFWSSSAASDPQLSEWVGELSEEQKVSSLSGGQWMRLRLAMALVSEPGLLILDEPTNDLDLHSRQWFYQFLQRYQGGLLLISHDREALQAMDEIYELSNQGLQNYKGNFEEYQRLSKQERSKQEAKLETAKRESQRRHAERTEKVQAKEKRDRTAKAKAPDMGLPKILLGARKRAAQKSLAKLQIQEGHFVEEAQAELQESLQRMKLDPFTRFDFAATRPHSSKTHFEAIDFNFAWSPEEKPLWKKPVRFQIRGSERWRLAGPNGSGKTTLLKILLGQNPSVEMRANGQAHCRTKAFAYLDQKYGQLDPKRSLLENFEGRSRFDVITLRNELAFFGLTKEKPNQKVETLSGGELLRSTLAFALLGGTVPEVLILDEPTNNLDLQSLELLEEALRNFQGALVVVSHDEKFVESLQITHTLDLGSFEKV